LTGSITLNRNPTIGTRRQTAADRYPTRLFVYASRRYLGHRKAACPHHARLATFTDLFGCEEKRLLPPLAKIWERMLVLSDSAIALHELDCDGLTLHEQAIVTAVRYLQAADEPAAASTLTAVLPPAGVRLIRPEMNDLAEAMRGLASAACGFSQQTMRPSLTAGRASERGVRWLH
jgi:hypothetical protein